MSYDTPERVELGAEDRDRIRRLTEEVRGRLEEISLIAGPSSRVSRSTPAGLRFREGR